MKKHISNTDISRRKALKEFALLSGGAFLPRHLSSNIENTPSIHFIGLGAAGSNTLDLFLSKKIKGKFTYVSDIENPKLSKEATFIKFTPPYLPYFPSRPEILRIPDMKHKIEIPDCLLNIFQSNDNFVLLSGLGRYTGTLMTQELTLLLNKQGKRFISISSIPFEFEGKRSNDIAKRTMDKLKYIPNFKYYEFDNIRLKYGNLALPDAFKKADELSLEIYKTNKQKIY